MNWQKNLKGVLKLSEPLCRHTTFKIGGPAEVFFRPKDARDLKALLKTSNSLSKRVLILGAGSNILASDRGVKGVVIQLSSHHFKKINLKGDFLEAGAGVFLSKIIAKARQNNLSGPEFLIGIPGTIGGGLIMNAGLGREGPAIGDLVETVTVMDYNGKVKVLNKKDIDFAYRCSDLSGHIILKAKLRLRAKSAKEIQGNLRHFLEYRKISQDAKSHSAGCIFKNPTSSSAGKLIDLCGLKGKAIGGAGVSDKHANFIINKGKAKAQDVLRLMRLVSKQVKNKFGVELHPEIKIWQ